MTTLTFGGTIEVKASETMAERVLMEAGEELFVMTSNEARSIAAALMLEADKADAPKSPPIPYASKSDVSSFLEMATGRKRPKK